MFRTYLISATPPAPYTPGEKLPVGPTDGRDPEGRAFVAQWLAHVAVGNIGGHLVGPTAPLLEAQPVNEEARAIVLANERLMFGDRRRPIG